MIWANSEIQRRHVRGTRKFCSGSSIDEDTKSKLEEMRVRMLEKLIAENDMTPESAVFYSCLITVPDIESDQRAMPHLL